MRFLPSLRNGPVGPPRLRVRLPRSLRCAFCLAVLASVSALARQAVAEAGDEVVASFTGSAITRADLEAVLSMRLPFERERLMREAGVREVLERLVRYDLLVQEAEARGYRDSMPVRDAAQAKANDLLIQDVASVDPQSIGAAEIARAYERQRREFSRPALRRASQIVLSSKAEAQALIAELKGVDRERFARIATERSQDPATSKQGGELGYFDREGKTERGSPALASAPLAAAAFKLRRVGELAPEPIAQAGGYSVLLLTGEMPAFETPRAEAEERIREELAKSQSTAKLEAFLNELRERYKPVVHEALVDLVVLPKAQPAQIPSGFPAAPPDPREPPKVVEPDGF